MTPDQPDPLLASLAALSGSTPAAEHDVRVRARCHAILAASAGREPAPRTRTQRAVDAGLAIAASLYGLMTIVEALRIARLLL
jgi:hypothetical protein